MNIVKKLFNIIKCNYLHLGCKNGDLTFGEFCKLFGNKDVEYIELRENNLYWIYSKCPKCGAIRMFSCHLSIIIPDELCGKGIVGSYKTLDNVANSMLEILKSGYIDWYVTKNDIKLIKYTESNGKILKEILFAPNELNVKWWGY